MWNRNTKIKWTNYHRLLTSSRVFLRIKIHNELEVRRIRKQGTGREVNYLNRLVKFLIHSIRKNN
jgi:hypothetical protein